MNEDFLIPKTPAKARLLMRLAALNEHVTLSPEIIALASEGVLTDADFTALPLPVCSVGRSALQLILDFDLRAVVPEVHPAYKRPLLLCAAKLAGVSPIIVFSAEPEPWVRAAMRVGVGIVLAPLDMLSDPSWQKDKRAGVVFVENGPLPGVVDLHSTLIMVGREWRRTIICGDPDYDAARLHLRHGKTHYYKARHWSESAGLHTMLSALAPTIPFGPNGMKTALARELPVRGFKNAHVASAAFLFGLVVPSE